MGFRINTNIAAINSHNYGVMNNRSLNESLSKLSSGLRINKAADDASGMAIADSLRSQASSLNQAIANANDTISIMQIADKAMDEQIKILDTIKVKATQAAQDGQTTDTRKALQQDISRLMEELDNIAGTTSYNGLQLLSGQFTNKEFQIGAFSNQTVKASIGATSSDKIGLTRFETGGAITAGSVATLKFLDVDGVHDITLESVVVSTGAGTGIGVLAEVINKNSDRVGAKASWQVLETASAAITTGNITGLTINSVVIGDINDIKANDSDGKLVAAINAVKDQTGVEASIDNRGHLNIRSIDGRGIKIDGTNISSVGGLGTSAVENYGRLTLTRLDARDIIVSGTNASTVGLHTAAGLAEANINLRTVRGAFTNDQASAMGAHPNAQVELNSGISAGVTTLRGAMAVMDIAEAATRMLDKVRSDIGSVQNQVVATVNNISVTQTNVKAAESQIRDVDFASESATFQKHNLLSQSGSYAMSQANAVQQNVMKLLQ